jgi:hypothetical protein
MRFKFAIILLLIFCTGFTRADDVKFTASASKTEIGTEEHLEVTFTVNRNVNDFTPPKFTNFRILSGPNQSTSMSWINGVSSASTSFSYILVPLQEGEFTVQPASINVKGQQFNSNPLYIKVFKGKGTGASSAQKSRGSQQQEMRVSRRIEDINKQVMIRAVVDKTNAYVGEQIILSFKLYTQLALSGSNLDKIPALNGFWSQDINNANQQIEWRTEIYNGQEYNVADLKQTILFPERPGTLTIDPLEMTLLVRQFSGGNSIIDQFFGSYEDVKHSLKSKALKINVKPLPDTGKPDGFAGAVGQFNFEALTDKQELQANEALNYKLKITGSGNIPLINAPALNFPPDFEKYDPKVKDDYRESANGISGSREYEYLLIPRHPGDYTIDAFNFSYFDPQTGKYVDLKSNDFPIKVNPGKAENEAKVVLPQNQQSITDNDIRYIKTDSPKLRRVDESFYGSQLFYFMLASGPFAFLIALALKKWIKNRVGNMADQQNKKANKLAIKYLNDARQEINGDIKLFYDAIYKGLYNYLSYKLNIPFANLNKEAIALQLQSKDVDQQLINKLIQTLDQCEMARFAPLKDQSVSDVYNSAKTTIKNIEQTLS